MEIYMHHLQSKTKNTFTVRKLHSMNLKYRKKKCIYFLFFCQRNIIQNKKLNEEFNQKRNTVTSIEEKINPIAFHKYRERKIRVYN